MDIQNIKLGFIGSGNMASAIIKGIIDNGLIKSEDIFTYDKDTSKRDELCNNLKVNSANNNMELINKCDVIILAVKPAFVKDALSEIKTGLNNKHLIISIAAGVSTSYIRDLIDNSCSVIRVMPNTPALVGEGVTAVCKHKDLPEVKISIAKQIFSSCGSVELIEEKYMDAITAISGSSPAYIFMLIEAMADGGVLMGLPRDLCYRVISQAVLGSAMMILKNDRHPGELKDMVCSPGGTTIEAVRILENSGFRSALIEAVKACTEKSRKLGSTMK